MKKTLSLLLGLFIILISCSKSGEGPEPKAPTITGLDFTITTNQENPLQVGVTPTATGASSYKVYFDVAGAPSTFEETSGSIVTYTYPKMSATYSIKVVATADGAANVELTKEHTITVVPDTVLSDFESVNPPYLIDDLTASIVVVEGPIGTNETKVGKITNNSSDIINWESVQIINTKYIDLTDVTKRVISLDFYQQDAATPNIGIKFEIALTEGVSDIELTRKAVETAGWQTIEFDFGSDDVENSFPNHENPTITFDQYQSIVIFIGYGENAAGEYYIDNLTGAQLSSTDIPDTDGDSVIDPLDGCIDTAGTVENDGCPAGPSTAPTAPTRAASEVLSIYSNTYTANPEVTTYETAWSTNATIENVEITTGENALKATILNANGYAGIAFSESFDTSAYNTIHFDVWTPGLSSFKFKLEGSNPDEAVEVTVPITRSSGWESVNVPISAAITDVNLAVISGADAGQVYIDNVYLYVDDTLPTSTVLNIIAPEDAISVRISGPRWGWDPNGGPVAVANETGTWDVIFSPGLTENLEFLIIVDGVEENLIDFHAAAGKCTSRIEDGTLITDFDSYASRIWLSGSGTQSYVYSSCE